MPRSYPTRCWGDAICHFMRTIAVLVTTEPSSAPYGTATSRRNTTQHTIRQRCTSFLSLEMDEPNPLQFMHTILQNRQIYDCTNADCLGALGGSFESQAHCKDEVEVGTLLPVPVVWFDVVDEGLGFLVRGVVAVAVVVLICRYCKPVGIITRRKEKEAYGHEGQCRGRRIRT